MRPVRLSSALRVLTSAILLVTALSVTACRKPGAPQAKEQATAAAHETAADLLPLPTFASCTSSTHPGLPAKWEAVGLMQDFFQTSFVVGRFVYDESAKAFEFSLDDPFGIDEDYIVTADRKLYRLNGGADHPTSCTYLTASSPFTMPDRDWLDTGAVCVGQAPILDRPQEWWKSPSGPGANWYWYNSSDRLPFRSMYYADTKPTTPVPVYEHFTFNYFPTFKEVPSTNLASIVAMCQKGNPAPVATAEYAKPSIEPLLAKRTAQQKADRFTEIGQLIPGVTACSSKDALPPAWPNQVQATVFMTAVSFAPNPFPTRVFYDWSKQSQNSTLNNFPQTPENGAQTALLVGTTGYIEMVRQDGSVSSCDQVLPGPQVPNWKSVDGCECRAQIAPHTVLNPSDVSTKILWCPTDLSAKQVFWTWYSDTGTPVVFMQSNSSPTDGTGLNLADYYHWKPGSVAPPGTFDISPVCQGQPVKQVPQACHNCHLPTTARKPGL